MKGKIQIMEKMHHMLLLPHKICLIKFVERFILFSGLLLSQVSVVQKSNMFHNWVWLLKCWITQNRPGVVGTFFTNIGKHHVTVVTLYRMPFPILHHGSTVCWSWVDVCFLPVGIINWKVSIVWVRNQLFSHTSLWLLWTVAAALTFTAVKPDPGSFLLQITTSNPPNPVSLSTERNRLIGWNIDLKRLNLNFLFTSSNVHYPYSPRIYSFSAALPIDTRFAPSASHAFSACFPIMVGFTNL